VALAVERRAVEHQLGHEVGPDVHHERGPGFTTLEQLRVVANLGPICKSFVTSCTYIYRYIYVC
jgi:hypothetical protein